MLVILCIVKRQPKLKTRYKQRVEGAITYVRMIEDFDDLVDPRTLAFHCLAPEPSAFVLQNIEIEEKRVSVKFIHAVFYFFFFFKQVFSSCRDDDKI